MTTASTITIESVLPTSTSVTATAILISFDSEYDTFYIIALVRLYLLEHYILRINKNSLLANVNHYYILI